MNYINLKNVVIVNITIFVMENGNNIFVFSLCYLVCVLGVVIQDVYDINALILRGFDNWSKSFAPVLSK